MEKATLKVMFLDPPMYSSVYDYDACYELRRAGFDATLYTCASIHHDDFPKAPEIPIDFHYFRKTNAISYGRKSENLRRCFRGVEYVLDSRRMVRKAIQQQVDVVHYNWAPIPTLDLLAIRTLRKRGIRVVFTAHNPFPHDQPETSITRMSGIFRSVNTIVTLTDYAKDTILRYFPDVCDKSAVVPHFSGEAFFATIDECSTLADSLKKRFEDKIVFGCIGIIRPYKGVPDLIKAYGEVRLKNKNVALLIVGKVWPAAKCEVELAISKLSDKSDVVTDFRCVSHSEYLAYLRNMDVLVQPYRNASQSGNTALAYRLGKPVISTTAGGLKEEVCEGITGYTTPPGDIVALTKAMLRLTNNDTLQRLGKGCLERARDYYDGLRLVQLLSNAYGIEIAIIQK